MFIALAILHVLVCVFLILVVLLQSGRGGGMGAAFGGGTQAVFGGGGAASFLSKLTAISAGIFMLTSISLAWLSSSASGERSLREAAQQTHERAKARRVARSKRPTKAAGMSSGDEDAGSAAVPAVRTAVDSGTE